MTESIPKPRPAPGLFGREEAIVDRLRAFLAAHEARTAAAEEQRREQTAAAEKKHAISIARAGEELQRRLAKADAQFAEALERLDTQFAEREAQLTLAWETKRSVQQERHERRIDRNERERREAIWLAETVLESGKPKPGQEFNALCKQLEAGLKAVGESEAFVGSLWPNLSIAPSASLDAGDRESETQSGPASGAEISQRPPADAPDGFEAFDALRTEVHERARALDRLRLPAFFRSGLPMVLGPIAVGGAILGVGFATGWAGWQLPAAAGGVALVLVLVLLVPLRRAAVRQFLAARAEFDTVLTAARASASAVRAAGERERDRAVAALVEQCQAEVDRAETEALEARTSLDTEHSELSSLIEREGQRALDELKERDAHDRAEDERKVAEYRENAHATHAQETAAANSERDAAAEAAESAHRAVTNQCAAAWTCHMRRLRAELAEITDHAARSCPAWSRRLDGSWRFDHELPVGTRVGQVDVALADLGPGLPADPVLRSLAPESLTLPIMLDVASRGSLLVECDAAGRDAAIRLVQTVLLRLLVSTPPGRAKLTIFDPVGRGRSFAGLMRLADFDESLVGSRIWTESRHMEQRLTDLTEHIENVIQKYLRDDYASIDDYNRIAGEIAEPYRYLVIADFPANFTEDAAARLASIIDAGARCGVFVVVLVDPAGKLPPGFDIRELRARAVVIEGRPDESFRLASKALHELPFIPDPAPGETQTIELLRRVGEEAQMAGRVEVSYRVAEPSPGHVWSRSCAEELRIPIGRAGATKAQELRLGRGTSQHALIAGKTGSGKSTLLHVLATAAMLWHAPSEVEFYLVDFKKGVEFKPYASGGLPHIRAVAIESDREFGLSVLQRLDTELRRRGDLYREHGVQSLAQFRERFPDEPMPRSILIIDEFQEFFTEDDRIAQDASLLLDRLVRQGRAFGIHVLLASQTLSGAYSLARSTVGQMAVRIALKCSETDSYLILSEDNGAARLLSRPGEAIYNDANGLVEGNNPFQVAWLGDDERHEVLGHIETLAKRHQVTFEEPVFFEGNAAADLDRNRLLRKAVRERARPIAPLAWLGEPVSIKEPTGAIMRRRGGANLLIIGQRSETAAAMVAASILGLATQHEHEGPRAARFLVVDGTPEDDPLAGRLHAAVTPLPHDVRPVPWRDAPKAVAEAHAERQAREAANRTDGQPIYLALHGLHWLRALRRKEDDFSFSVDADKGPTPDQQLRELLIDGPRLGVFVIAWCDTVGSLTRALDRASMAEFGNRVLMQMSANDSSMLIESTSAARLGLHRAIFFDEERGAEEKFRPYGLPEPSFVKQLAADLAS